MTSRLLVDKIEGKTTANTVQMPSGSVIQVVTREIVTSDQVTFSSSSHTDSITINFTPKFANSIVKHHFWGLSALNNVSYNKGQDCRWLRDSTVLSSQSWTNYFNRNTNPIADYYPTLNWHYVDTPNTTNQVTYKFQGRSYGGNGSDYSWVAFENNGGTGNRGQWTIEEIAQ
jgi:hypothetical protein|tara:strand:- start:36 stop:551 length:516 start_codon:yes stop_codon:yes gene_type:complete